MQFFGTSGIRRIADKELVRVALNVGMAVGDAYGDVAVGYDTRTSGSALKHALISGVLSGGGKCHDAGVLPTPTLALAIRHFKAGLMVTASHNPPEYNGIKPLNPDGSAFDSRQRKQLEEAVLKDTVVATQWQDMKTSDIYAEAIEQHIERILKDFPGQYKLKVVVDCGCGAASVISPYLLRKMGCEVIGLHCYPSGHFPRNAEPTEENLSDLIRVTRELGADLGIAHDGDSDRMMAVDDKGRFISGDKLLAIFARGMEAKDIVTTIDASMSIDEMGFNIRRTEVGDPYVSEELKKSGQFGGEPSGAWVFPNISLCPDGIYSAAQIVAIASQQKLSHLVDSIPSYPVLRGSIASDGVAMSVMKQKLMDMKPISTSKIDGLKLSFSDGWVLVRPSGTEPKIRLTAEARTEARARQLYQQAIEVIKRSQ
ncbi:MAG: phosphoglucosamine mutase [Chloroflexi bacterium]|nr:phosphoglucosamine mutase [Chloroflexota bacterium]